MKSLLFALIVVSGMNVHATGGFECSYLRDSIDLRVNAVTSWSFENAIVDFIGQAKGSMGDDGSVYRFDYLFSKADVVQYWNSGNEFKLVIYRENEAGEPIKAVIQTTSQNGTDFQGTVQISSGANWSMEDRISCTVE